MHETELRHEFITTHLSDLQREAALQRGCARPRRWHWLLTQARRLEGWLERRALLERGQEEARWARE